MFYFLAMVVLLTILTQTGGLLLVLAYILWRVFKWDVAWARFGSFFALYFIINFTFVPWLAGTFHKKALPIDHELLRPQNWFTVLTNRHYVDEELYNLLLTVGEDLQSRYPERKLVYLDAGFPLGARFPLLPHRAHNDGKAIDLAFAYTNVQSEEAIRRSPNWLGYGRYTGPNEGEPNWPQKCRQQGNRFYSLPYVLALREFPDVKVDQAATRFQLQLFAESGNTSRIFLEPHLKQRWGLMRHDKIRFHGCKAMRHDDHYHLSIR